MNLLIDDLRGLIASGEAVVVVGAGVSMAATSGAPTACWVGLLEDGISRCEEVGSEVPSGWGDVVRKLLALGDRDSMLSVAESVTSKLGGPKGGEYGRWLRESVGTLPITDRSVLDAVAGLKVPLATTNYDGLLEKATGLGSVTWLAGPSVQRVIRGADRKIMHFHGHWEAPESVVLGFRSYAAVLGDATAQAIQQALAVTRALVFVGFGGGLADPNFTALREWMTRTMRNSEYRHFRLVREDEFQRITAEHQPAERVMVVSYGESNDDLAPFLRTLRPPEPKPAALKEEQRRERAESVPAWRPCFGRDAVIEEIVGGVLRAAPMPTPVLGAPGIGKSAVSRALVHDPSVIERFGQRRYWVRCDGATTAQALLADIATTLGVPLARDLMPRVIAALADRPVLLVLDNAETPWIADLADTEELLTRLSQVPEIALVASFRGSQRPLGPVWRSSIQVPPLDALHARKLFLAVAGDRFAADPQLEQLLIELDGMPIAIELLAYQAQAENSLTDLRARWEQRRIKLLERGADPDRHLSVATSFEISINSPRVSPGARRLLTLLGWLPDGIAIDGLDDVFSEQPLDAAASLRGAGLALAEHGRLRTLKPIRDHVAVEHRPRPEDRAHATAHYLQLTNALGDDVFRQGGGEANARLSAETANLECVLSRALDGSSPGSALDAVHALSSFVVATGAPIEALFDHAVTRARESGECNREANALVDCGRIALARSDDTAASKRFERALALHREAGNVHGEAICLRGLGEVAMARWDHESAVERLEQARELFRKVGDARGEGTCVRGLGRTAQNRGDDDEARQRLNQALQLFRDAGDVLGKATCLMRLGELDVDLGEDLRSKQHFEQALPLYREAGSVLGEANCVVGLGNVALVRGDYAAAREHFARALTSFERLQERYSIGQTHRRLATVSPDARTGQTHRDAAVAAWTSIGRHDLVERHFGQQGS